MLMLLMSPSTLDMLESNLSFTSQVLPLYWPCEASLQSKVVKSLQSAEHGVGRASFGSQNLRVTTNTETDGHIIVSGATISTAWECIVLDS